MAKSYLQLNNTITTFIDEHNSLVNKVGDLANLATTGDSDLIQAINEIHNSDSDNNSLIDSADTKLTTAWGLIDSADTKLTTAWGLIDSADTKLTTAWGLIDSADTKLSSVQLVADSAQTRIDGLITDRTAFPSNFIPDADGTRNLGADATRWNATYHDYARVTNNIHVGNGSAATPAFAFEGDTNTGIYRSAADELSVSTNGVERMRINSAGDVGLGTTNPATKLHVSDTNVPVVIDSLNGNLYKIALRDAGGTVSYLGSSSAIPFSIADSGTTERWRVSNEPRAESSVGVTSTINQWSSFTTLVSEQFIAQSTGILITGDLFFSGAGLAMYVYSRVKLIVTGGAAFAVGGTQIDGLSASAPFDYVSQSPSLAVTGLTVGGDYTVVLEVAKGNAAACTAQGLVNYVHG